MESRNFLYDTVLPKVEVLSALMAAAGLALKLALKPGGDVLLLVGLGTLATVYFLSAYQPLKPTAGDLPGNVSFNSEIDAGRSFLAEAIAPKLAGLGASVSLLGALFKLLSWNGAAVMLLVGVVTLGLAALLLASAGRLPRKYLLVLVFGASIWAIPAEALIQQFHRNDLALTQLLLFRLHHPHDRAANEAVRQYLRTRHK